MDNENDIRSAAPGFFAPKHDFSELHRRENSFDDSHLWSQGEFVERIDLAPVVIPDQSTLKKVVDAIRRFWRPVTWLIILSLFIRVFDTGSGPLPAIIIYTIISAVIHFKYPNNSPWKIGPATHYFYYNISDRGSNPALTRWAEETFGNFAHKSEKANLFGGELEQIQITAGHEVFIILGAREGYSAQVLYAAINEYTSVLGCQGLKPVAYNQARLKLQAIPK